MDLTKLRKELALKEENSAKKHEIINTIRDYRNRKIDSDYESTELFKPIISSQREVKETIDRKQDKLIEQLHDNQRAIVSGFEDIVLFNQLPESKLESESTKLPIDYKPSIISANLDKGFNDDDELSMLEKKYGLVKPSKLIEDQYSGDDVKQISKNVGKILQKLGSQKGNMSKKNIKSSSKDAIKKLDEEKEILNAYKSRINTIPEGKKTIGQGVRKYKQPKRNAYKINGGEYGGLMINVPRLLDEMVVECHKDGRKFMKRDVIRAWLIC